MGLVVFATSPGEAALPLCELSFCARARNHDPSLRRGKRLSGAAGARCLCKATRNRAGSNPAPATSIIGSRPTSRLIGTNPANFPEAYFWIISVLPTIRQLAPTSMLFDEAQLSEFVHEIVHTRTAGATISAGVGATRFSPAETPAP